MKQPEPVVVYKHPSYGLKMKTNQVPLIVYDCEPLGEGYKQCRFQCLVDSNTYTVFKTKEEVMQAYPHVKI